MSDTRSSHPSDRLLVCALDGELSTQETAALEIHLRHCEPCRARAAELAAAENDIRREYRSEPDSVPGRDRLLARIRTQMTARAAVWHRSRWFRLRRAATFSSALRLAALAAVLAPVVNVAWRSYLTVERPTFQEMEAAALPI